MSQIVDLRVRPILIKASVSRIQIRRYKSCDEVTFSVRLGSGLVRIVTARVRPGKGKQYVRRFVETDLLWSDA